MMDTKKAERIFEQLKKVTPRFFDTDIVNGEDKLYINNKKDIITFIYTIVGD